jgi:hypothetical protein
MVTHKQRVIIAAAAVAIVFYYRSRQQHRRRCRRQQLARIVRRPPYRPPLDYQRCDWSLDTWGEGSPVKVKLYLRYDKKPLFIF